MLHNTISHACGSSRAFSDLVEELLGSGVLALSQPPMRFMMQCYVRREQIKGNDAGKYQDGRKRESEAEEAITPKSADRCCSCPMVNTVGAREP